MATPLPAPEFALPPADRPFVTDPIADGVLTGNYDEGAVAIDGHLGPLIMVAGAPDLRRVYTDSTFWCWVEVKDDDILCFISGAQDPRDPRGVVYVRREAIVAWCKAGRAYSHEDESTNDPTAYPNRRP